MNKQIELLANFIMENVEGEPSQSEGAVDCAIRIIANLQVKVAKLERVARAAGESLVRLSPNSERVVLLGDGKELFEALADLLDDALGG